MKKLNYPLLGMILQVSGMLLITSHHSKIIKKIFFRWKETQWNTNQQAVQSQVSAMNAATAQMVTLTGQGDGTDHNAVGAAVNTISTNLPDMAREVKMLAALMDDKAMEGDDLMGAARTLCGAFSDMLSSAAPQTNEVTNRNCNCYFSQLTKNQSFLHDLTGQVQKSFKRQKFAK